MPFKIDPVTWVKELPPQKLLNLILILGIMSLFGWLKILIGNDSNDKKAALETAEKRCDELLKQREKRIDLLEYKYDSVRVQQYNDKLSTIQQLEHTLDKTRFINNKLKKQK